MQKVKFHAEIFREGEQYVGLCPELNVSSFGDSIKEAKRSLHEAVEAFVEECELMGTLDEVMEEAGFIKQDSTWMPRKAVVRQVLSVG